MRYNYAELEAKALAPEASPEDIAALAEWFNQYGDMYWNGEYYQINSRFRLYPVYDEVDEDEYEISGYEIR